MNQKAMAQLDNNLKTEFEGLCEKLESKKVKLLWRIRDKISSIRKAIGGVLNGSQSNNKISTLNTSLIIFNQRVKQILQEGPEETSAEILDSDEDYVEKKFRGHGTRKLMLYLIKHLDEPKTTEEASQATGFTIRQLYDTKDYLTKKLIKKNHQFILDTVRSKQGVYKLIRKLTLDEKRAEYTKKDIEAAKAWVAANFKAYLQARFMTILAENMGEFVSLEQIEAKITEIPRNHLSTYICRLAERLIKQKKPYIIEKERGRYRLVENTDLTKELYAMPIKNSPAFKIWADEVSQNNLVHKAVMACLSENSLEQKTKIADLQNKIIKDHPSENAAGLNEKIGNFIIKICGRLQNGKFRAVAEKGNIAIHLSKKLLKEEAAPENGYQFYHTPIHIPLYSRHGSIKPANF